MGKRISKSLLAPRFTNSRIRRRRATPPGFKVVHLSERSYRLSFSDQVLNAARDCRRPSDTFESRMSDLAERLGVRPPLLAMFGPSGRLYETSSDGGSGTALTRLYCWNIITGGEMLTVDDTETIAPEIGSFLGVPVRVEGRTIGALCVVDGQPRIWLGEERSHLQELASALALRIEARLIVTPL